MVMAPLLRQGRIMEIAILTFIAEVQTLLIQSFGGLLVAARCGLVLIDFPAFRHY